MKKRSMVNTKRSMDNLTINVFIAKLINSYTTFNIHNMHLDAYIESNISGKLMKILKLETFNVVDLAYNFYLLLKFLGRGIP